MGTFRTKIVLRYEWKHNKKCLFTAMLSGSFRRLLKTKAVYDAYRKAKNKENTALQSEYEALQAQKEALYADYGKLKKQVREYDVIKQNIDSILRVERQTERE